MTCNFAADGGGGRAACTPYQLQPGKTECWHEPTCNERASISMLDPPNIFAKYCTGGFLPGLCVNNGSRVLALMTTSFALTLDSGHFAGTRKKVGRRALLINVHKHPLIASLQFARSALNR